MSLVSSRFLPNEFVERGAYPHDLRSILSAAKTADAARDICGWSGYGATQLHDLSALANDLNIRRLWYKDESRRFGLGSFKALGGAYAVYRILERLGGVDGITFACATAGNHGISVAWAAKRWGAKCIVYVPSTIPQERVDLLRSHGADVRVTGSVYDYAVDQLAADAERSGWHVVSDTAYPGYVDVPADVMHGYTILAREIVEQIPAGERITHTFLQCGVGGLSSSVLAHLWETLGADRPVTVIVEPDSAACFFESVRHGAFAEVDSDMRTQLVCLACARLSILAWPILNRGADFAMTIDDKAAFEGMKKIANASGGAIACGECGAAGLGGLLTALAEPSVASQMSLGPGSNVLIIGTEGPQNGRLYAQITGGAI